MPGLDFLEMFTVYIKKFRESAKSRLYPFSSELTRKLERILYRRLLNQIYFD